MDDLLRASAADALQAEVIEFSSGATAVTDAAEFDWRRAIERAQQGQQCQPLPAERDPLGIACRPELGRVVQVRQGRHLSLLVLPIYGRGYQSTLHALLVLHGDLNTIAALQVQEQGETPGLGARIAEADWLAKFSGKQLRDAGGDWQFAVRKRVERAAFEVDSIAGATRSSTTLGQMVEFWLGPDGYGPMIDRLNSESAP